MYGIDIISSALRLLNVIAVGETPTDDQAETGMAVFNDMLAAWGLERLMVFNIQRLVLTPSTLKQTYSLGLGGDFNIVRPNRIERVGVISLNNPVQPLELPMEYTIDSSVWSEVPVKAISSTLPQIMYDDVAFPQRNLSVWPIPTVGIQFAFYVWSQLTKMTDTQLDLEFPPGYNEAIRYNLAVRLAPEFNAELRPDVAGLAASAIAKIKSNNIVIPEAHCDPALVARGRKAFNWITGE